MSNPNRKFYAADGQIYTAADLGTLDELPTTTIFEDLDLKGQDISRLPRNLTVRGYLNLGRTAITELPANLNVADAHLRLEYSQVTGLPDNLVVSRLDICNSSLTSIGQNIKCGEIYLDSTVMLTNLLTCEDCTILTREDPRDEIFDLANLTVKHRLTIKGVKGRATITNYKGNHCLCHMSCNKGELVFESSSIKKLNYMHGFSTTKASLTLVLKDSVTCASFNLFNGQMVVNSQPVLISLCGAKIEKVYVAENLLSRLTFTDLCLFGDLFIDPQSAEPRTRFPLLPNRVLIYGDLTVPKWVTLPEQFCCFGEVIVGN